MQEDGIIYVLVNDAMPDYVKIGMTQTSVEQRMAELDKTGVPLPFRCHFAVRVENVKQKEKLVHDIFGDYRARQNREFFTVSPERVVSALILAGGKPIQNIEGKIIDETNTEVSESANAKQRRKPISLYKLGIKDGDELTFTRDSNIKCKVVGEKEVEYDGKVWSLSGLANHLLQYGVNVSGTLYFEYNGEALLTLRERLENEGEND
jgi:hypothetical protein